MKTGLWVWRSRQSLNFVIKQRYYIVAEREVAKVVSDVLTGLCVGRSERSLKFMNYRGVVGQLERRDDRLQ
jgi:hypothetical protein